MNDNEIRKKLEAIQQSLEQLEYQAIARNYQLSVIMGLVGFLVLIVFLEAK